MPIYEYRRPDGSTFEILQSITAEPLTEDPETRRPRRARPARPRRPLQGLGLLQHRLRDQEARPGDEGVGRSKQLVLVGRQLVVLGQLVVVLLVQERVQDELDEQRLLLVVIVLLLLGLGTERRRASLRPAIRRCRMAGPTCVGWAGPESAGPGLQGGDRAPVHAAHPRPPERLPRRERWPRTRLDAGTRRTMQRRRRARRRQRAAARRDRDDRCGCAAARRSSATARSPTPRSCWPATTCSTSPTSTRPGLGGAGCPNRATAPSRCGPSSCYAQAAA